MILLDLQGKLFNVDFPVDLAITIEFSMFYDQWKLGFVILKLNDKIKYDYDNLRF